MTRIFSSLLIFCVCCSLFAQHNIIPQPFSFKTKQEVFVLDENVGFISSINNSEASSFLQRQISMITGYTLLNKTSNRNIWLTLLPQDSLQSNEAYFLSVKKDSIVINAFTEKGLAHGIQSLLILFDKNKSCFLGCDIFDKPQYAYRAMHLDVCRHFFGKEVVKQYIGLLAALKMNTLHLHLTDDQGWRVEIKKYPRLTEVGAWRIEKDGSRYGGYFSQSDLKELVDFAAQRHINIIPEIELPGHASAAIAAYPFLSCSGKEIDVPNTWGIKQDIFCPTDSTLRFLKDVLDEVCDIFPSPFIHIGGDEVPKAQWKKSAFVSDLMRAKSFKNYDAVQQYFMNEIENHLAAKGRRAIGWGEVMKSGVNKNIIVMSWLSKTAGNKAIKNGNATIMAPRFYCYFDYPRSSKDKLQAIWMTPVPLKKVYKFNPAGKNVSTENKHLLLGGEAAVWTEYITNEKQLLYQVMPRLAAMSEALWSNEKNYDDFLRRINSLK
jgi:hexosaminidase